jgi:CHASE2 domain-containing sensor protein
VSFAGSKRIGPLLLILLLLMLLAAQPPFTFGLRHALFDTYQKLFPRERKSAPALIVAIDERALARHGQCQPRRKRVESTTGSAKASQ